MPNLDSRSRALTDSEREEFEAVHGHLAYRYTMLWTHKEKVANKKPIEYCQAICAFEASLVACRVFMEFLGLGIDYSPSPTLRQKRKYFSRDRMTTDEVKVVDLGGRFANLDDMTADERDLLATVFHMAHKAAAHLTCGAPFMREADIVHKAIPVIDRLLRQNFYQRVGIEPRRHWD